MLKIKYLLITLAIFAAASADLTAGGKKSQPVEIRVGTYNLWRSDLGKEDYRWELRKERLVKSILDCNIDIFTAEEVDTTIFREIPGMLENYAWLLFSPYSPDGSGSVKAQAIVYRKDKFKPLNFNHFWLSPTPGEMSSGWDEMKFKRGACCAEFKMLEGGRKFFFMASHFPLGREARLNIASLMIDREKKYNPKSLPSFFTGDLNTREERPESEILRTWWKDSYLELPADRKAGPKGTFNNHGLNEDMDIAPRIDFVYFRGGEIEPLRYVCDDTLYDGLYPSDHCPVYVDFLIH